MIVGVDHLSAGHIVVPQNEIIATGVEIVPDVLQRVDSFLVVAEGA